MTTNLNAQSVARFLIHELVELDPTGWLGAPKKVLHSARPKDSIAPTDWSELCHTKRQRQRLEGCIDYIDLLDHFMLKGIRESAQEGLLAWASGRAHLVPREDIPTPYDMFELQLQGRRYISLLPRDYPTPIGRHPHRLAFLLHDLEHAHKFFNEGTFDGQIQFFSFLSTRLKPLTQWQNDSQFVTDLNYLLSDMNTHPLHMFKYLKAIVLNAMIRQTNKPDVDLSRFWSEWAADIPGRLLEAMVKINKPNIETDSDRLLVSNFFMKGPLNYGELSH